MGEESLALPLLTSIDVSIILRQSSRFMLCGCVFLVELLNSSKAKKVGKSELRKLRYAHVYKVI